MGIQSTGDVIVQGALGHATSRSRHTTPSILRLCLLRQGYIVANLGRRTEKPREMGNDGSSISRVVAFPSAAYINEDSSPKYESTDDETPAEIINIMRPSPSRRCYLMIATTRWSNALPCSALSFGRTQWRCYCHSS